MGTENGESCSQRDSAERKGYVRAHRSFNRIWKERDSAEPDILGKILDKDNLNRAYKRVKANKGAPGIDGMTIEAALLWLKEHNRELTERIQRGKYTPSPVRRVEIPKPDGGIRKLGIPTVIDRIIQQAMLQQLMPIYEPLFSDDSFGYRPGRGARDAVFRIKEYIGQGYTRAVVLDLSKYFDTLNHTILLNLLRKQAKDERVIQMVKRYLKSGVMENGVVTETEEGSPQGGNLSPLLANVYLNEFDWEFHRRGVPCGLFVAMPSGNNPNKFTTRVETWSTAHPDWETAYYTFREEDGYVWSNVPTADATAITKDCENPERAMKALELLVMDEELNLLTQYGIKGVHYEVAEDGTYKNLDPSFGYEALNAWSLRNPEYKLANGQGGILMQEMFDHYEEVVEEKGTPSVDPFGSFTEDYNAYSAEKAAVDDVCSEYLEPLKQGLVDDVDAAVETFREKVTAAGLDVVREGWKEQWLAYLEENGL